MFLSRAPTTWGTAASRRCVAQFTVSAANLLSAKVTATSSPLGNARSCMSVASARASG